MRDIQLAAAGQTGAIFNPRPPERQTSEGDAPNFNQMLDDIVNKPRPYQTQPGKSLIEGLR